MLGPDPGFRAGAEKSFQAIVAKALDHGTVYRVAIRMAMPAWRAFWFGELRGDVGQEPITLFLDHLVTLTGARL